MTDRIPLDHLTSDALDALYEQLEAAEASETQRQLTAARKAFASATTRAARAEATISRVRALAQQWQASVRPGEPHPAAVAVLAVLDQPAPTAATQATGPREHCGDLKPPFSDTAERTECILRPGHHGSHADNTGCRWWHADNEHQEQPHA
ncbi:hypothetical protein ACFY8K_16900 [Streptomyces misionensis]|uniref:hypothetical protein n=1 Tax=Streptomyces misionensis TaxID=67331 RepID=UPI0036AC44C6